MFLNITYAAEIQKAFLTSDLCDTLIQNFSSDYIILEANHWFGLDA